MFREIVHSIEASSTLRRRNLITQPSQVTLDLCLRKAGSEKSRDYLDVIVSEKLRFLKSISSTLKRKTVDFKFVGFGERFRIGFGERFRKAPVSWGWGWVVEASEVSQPYPVNSQVLRWLTVLWRFYPRGQLSNKITESRGL